LQELQRKKNVLETQSINLDTEEIRFKRAKLQLDTITQSSDFMALQQRTGDVAMALEEYAKAHGGAGLEALSLVRGQSRTARGVGPAGAMKFEPDVVSRSGGNQSYETTSNVLLDGENVGRATHRHTLRHIARSAVTGGR
jgi:hypothetical protein